MRTGNGIVRVRASLQTLILALFMTMAALVSSHAEAGKVYKLTGTIGTTHVTMVLGVSDLKIDPSSHYFYDTELKDIPLTGTLVTAEGGIFILHLKEPGGGTFSLQYQDSGAHPDRLLYTGNSLNGMWSQDGKKLPVALTYVEGNDGGISERLYADIADESNEVFEARVRGFRDAVLAGDAKTAAKFTHFPLRVNLSSKQVLTIKSGQQLQSAWKQVFSDKWLADARAAVPHELFVRNSMAMLGNGLVWFGPKGAEVVNALP